MQLSGAMYVFDESWFDINHTKRRVVVSSSSLDAIDIIEHEDIHESLHFRIFADQENWILDVEGALDVVRHCKIMKISPISIALPLCSSAILLADQIGCDGIEIQCAVAGVEEGIQRAKLVESLVSLTKTTIVLWGVNHFEIPFQNPRVQYEKQMF